jgi:putative DNA primase/helicase
MDIVTFARLNGVLIDRLVEDGKWHRCPTEDHPRKKNGAYMTRGTYGFIQNHATHLEPVLWKPEDNEVAHLDHAAIARRAQEAAEQIRREQAAAAKKAGWIMHQCTQGPHPYLKAKGFPEDRGNLWQDEGACKLVIPMRADGRIVGIQTISDQDGFEKRFLYGQRTSEAVYLIVEGYATALSVAKAMHALKRRFTLIVCFSAGNLLKVARNHGEGMVIADNDKQTELAPEPGGMGLKVAKEIGLPFWISDRCPEDANDYHQRAGLFRLSQSLLRALPRRTA